MKYIKIYIALPILLLALITISSYINGLGCDYEMQLPTEGNIESIAVCRAGRINVVDTDTKTNDQWVVSAISFNVGNQIYMLVTNRYKSNDGTPSDVSLLDKIHQSHEGIIIYHYAWKQIDKNNIILFQKTPKDEVYIAKINGAIDFWMAIFGHEYQIDKIK